MFIWLGRRCDGATSPVTVGNGKGLTACSLGYSEPRPKHGDVHQSYLTSIFFSGFVSTGMAAAKRGKLSSRKERLLEGHIQKAVRDREIPKARQMIGRLVRDLFNDSNSVSKLVRN